ERQGAWRRDVESRGRRQGRGGYLHVAAARCRYDASAKGELRHQGCRPSLWCRLLQVIESKRENVGPGTAPTPIHNGLINPAFIMQMARLQHFAVPRKDDEMLAHRVVGFTLAIFVSIATAA